MAKKILSYSLFEGKTEDYKVEEFKKALDSPEGKDFQRWFGFNSVRTGRSYISKKNEIKEINIPSRSYFDFNGDRWYYEFASSNGAYGTTYNQDLKSLFRIFMVDSVRKSRPASITEKQIKEFFSKESNFPKGNFPDPEKIYSLIIAESGFITDFSFLEELPIIKRISAGNIESLKNLEVTIFDVNLKIGLFIDTLFNFCITFLIIYQIYAFTRNPDTSGLVDWLRKAENVVNEKIKEKHNVVIAIRT
jgi:hypothetical protein